MSTRQPASNAERVRLAVTLLRADLDPIMKDRIAAETILDIERLGIDLNLEGAAMDHVTRT